MCSESNRASRSNGTRYVRRPRSNISARNLQQIRQPKQSIRRHQPARSRNHNNPRQPTRRRSMRPRIRQLPPKIQPTDKAENFPERQPLFAKPHRQRKRRRLAQNHLRAHPGRIRRRQQKNPPPSAIYPAWSAHPRDASISSAAPTRALAPGVCPTNRIDFTRFPVPQPHATTTRLWVPHPPGFKRVRFFPMHPSPFRPSPFQSAQPSTHRTSYPP